MGVLGLLEDTHTALAGLFEEAVVRDLLAASIGKELPPFYELEDVAVVHVPGVDIMVPAR